MGSMRHLQNGVLTLALMAGAHVASAQGAKPAAPGTKTSAAVTKSANADATRETNIRAYAELLRSDLRAQKIAIITEVMQFSEAEDAKFWPVYREYEAELAKINDDRMALIKEYADNYAALTDPVADKLARRALDLEARRQTL